MERAGRSAARIVGPNCPFPEVGFGGAAAAIPADTIPDRAIVAGGHQELAPEKRR